MIASNYILFNNYPNLENIENSNKCSNYKDEYLSSH